jgi:peptidoglycan/LPS O-acetylase OafA/YrhL
MSVPPAASPTRGSSENFNVAVHALRAFATMMVFCAHMFDSFNTHFFPDCEALNLAMPYIKRFGTFGVELFFVISGYVIMNSVSKYDLREFLLRRVMRIYPMFAAFTLLFFSLNWLLHLFPERMSIGYLLLNLSFADIYFGTPAMSPNAWSLTYEANFYLLAGIGCFLLRKRLTVAFALFLLAALAFLVAFPIASYFIVGCVIYFARHWQPNAVPRALQIAATGIFCILAATISREGPWGPQSIAMNVLLLAATAFFFFTASVREGAFARLAAIRWIFFMGTISYSFYLAHPYSYYALRVLFLKLGLETLNIGTAAAIYFPTMAALAVAASYAAHRLLEVAPYRVVFGETVFKVRSAVASTVREARPTEQAASAVVQS